MTKIEHLNQLLSKLKSAVMDDTMNMTNKTVGRTYVYLYDHESGHDLECTRKQLASCEQGNVIVIH